MASVGHSWPVAGPQQVCSQHPPKTLEHNQPACLQATVIFFFYGMKSVSQQQIGNLVHALQCASALCLCGSPCLLRWEQRDTCVAAVCLVQAEQFANELTRHLGIAAPDCRIVRQVRGLSAQRHQAGSCGVVGKRVSSCRHIPGCPGASHAAVLC